MNDVIAKLDAIFGKKAPQLPAKFKEVIVKIAPYIIIIGLVFTALGLLALIPFMLGGAAVIGVAGYAPMYGNMTMVYISLAFGVVSAILELMALPGLFKRTRKSWELVFYACLVSLLSMLVSFNLVSLIVGGLISFYVLFQIRPYYTGATTMSSPSSTQS